MGKTGFDTCRRKALQNLFRQSFESSPESRGSQTSGVLFGSFCTTQKARKTFPLQGASRFCKPQISTPQLQLRTATIKTFLRKLRGFANLESAHKQYTFAQIKLNPSAAIHGIFPPFCKVQKGGQKTFPPFGDVMLLPQHFSPQAASFFASLRLPYKARTSLRALAAPLRSRLPGGKLCTDRGK